MKTNLKKIAALIFAAVFVFCLAACGGEQQKVSVSVLASMASTRALITADWAFCRG